jgi:tRNA(fMet)-specific endonuclease VapC
VIVLDTDVVSELMRPEPRASLVERLARVPADEQATTSVTIGELSYGASKADRPDLLDRALSLLRHVRVLDFDTAAARSYGALRAELEEAGAPLADPDLRIAAIVAAHAPASGVLVTGNVRHFERVPGLHVEDWIRA